jgi:hypothetical protein
MTTTDLLDIEDLARLLRRTEASIHSARCRNPVSIPPGFRVGRRLFWRSETVDEWLRDQEERQTRQRRKRRA